MVLYTARFSLSDSLFLLPLLVLIIVAQCSGTDSDEVSRGVDRQQKLFNVLQVVSFPNDACTGSSSRNGTCYTSAECVNRGGTNIGTCASGFGVCCTFSIGCGGMSSENCTYFEVNGAASGSCRATICPCSVNICQLRLDFDTFVISGPSTTSATAFTQINGVPSAATGNLPASLNTNCLTDTFTLTNPGGNGPSSICGTNSGEHMYVDSSASCNDLAFQIGTATSTTTRQWSIKVTQLSCDFDNLAPDGCTQYFFGSQSGTVQTYNFNNANGQHLANQDQNICFRRERGQCRICFATIATTDFMLSGPSALVAGLGAPTKCCGYGADGINISGFDCVQLPGASNAIGVVQNSRLCGRQALPGNSRCTTLTPFMLRFLSDNFEHTGAAITESGSGNDVGFRLGFAMDAINCPP